jgi:hypothetical protein
VASWVGIFENILTAWELEASNHCAMLFGTEKSEMGKITHIREFAVMHHHGATGLLPIDDAVREFEGRGERL